MERRARRPDAATTRVRTPLLPSTTRLGLVGSACALVFAVALGSFIPRQIERYLLRSEFDSDRVALDRLLAAQSVPPKNDQETRTLDAFVRNTVLAGDYVRVKLWSPDGHVLYSDEPRLIGRQYVPTGPLRAAVEGRTSQDISPLDEDENEYERGLGRRLLEMYEPIEDHEQVVAVWEVYRSLDRTDAAMRRIRLSVRVGVGFAIAFLFACLAVTFRSLLGAIRSRRNESEQLARHLSAVLGVSRAVASSLDPDELMTAAVAAVREESSFDTVALIRRREGAEDEVVASGGGELCPPGGRTLTAPFAFHDEAYALVACLRDDRSFTTCDRVFLETAADELTVALEKARLYQRLEAAEAEQRRLTGRLVSSTEEERKRIVGEIHDGLGQDLHRVLYGLRGCRAVPAAEADGELGQLEGVVEDSIRRLRRLLQELRPSTLDDVGLAASLRSLGDRFGVHDGLDVEVVDELEHEPAVPVRVAVFRIVQEALRNTVKHSSARSARVELHEDGAGLVVRVVDGGTGYRGEGDGLGMWLMRERAAAVGGVVTVSGDQGTAVEVRVPVEVPA